jgi:hypothetical protein
MICTDLVDGRHKLVLDVLDPKLAFLAEYA